MFDYYKTVTWCDQLDEPLASLAARCRVCYYMYVRILMVIFVLCMMTNKIIWWRWM